MLIRLSSDLVRRRMVAGASTLTMQLARNLFAERSRFHARRQEPGTQDQGNPRRDSDRKALHEARDPHASTAIRRIFGHGTYGVEAAARLYFGKRAKDVTLEEAAMIAGIIQTPARQSPYVNRGGREVPARLHAAADGRERLHHAGAGRRVQEEADRHARPAAAGPIGRALLHRGSPQVPRAEIRREGACTKAVCPCRPASTSGCSARPIAPSIAACAWSTSAAAIAATSRTSSRRGTTSRRTVTSDGRSRSGRTTSSRRSS